MFISNTHEAHNTNKEFYLIKTLIIHSGKYWTTRALIAEIKKVRREMQLEEGYINYNILNHDILKALCKEEIRQMYNAMFLSLLIPGAKIILPTITNSLKELFIQKYLQSAQHSRDRLNTLNMRLRVLCSRLYGEERSVFIFDNTPFDKLPMTQEHKNILNNVARFFKCKATFTALRFITSNKLRDYYKLRQFDYDSVDAIRTQYLNDYLNYMDKGVDVIRLTRIEYEQYITSLKQEISEPLNEYITIYNILMQTNTMIQAYLTYQINIGTKAKQPGSMTNCYTPLLISYTLRTIRHKQKERFKHDANITKKRVLCKMIKEAKIDFKSTCKCSLSVGFHEFVTEHFELALQQCNIKSTIATRYLALLDILYTYMLHKENITNQHYIYKSAYLFHNIISNKHKHKEHLFFGDPNDLYLHMRLWGETERSKPRACYRNDTFIQSNIKENWFERICDNNNLPSFHPVEYIVSLIMCDNKDDPKTRLTNKRYKDIVLNAYFEKVKDNMSTLAHIEHIADKIGEIVYNTLHTSPQELNEVYDSFIQQEYISSN